MDLQRGIFRLTVVCSTVAFVLGLWFCIDDLDNLLYRQERDTKILSVRTAYHANTTPAEFQKRLVYIPSVSLDDELRRLHAWSYSFDHPSAELGRAFRAAFLIPDPWTIVGTRPLSRPRVVEGWTISDPEPRRVWDDPKFHALSPEAKRIVLTKTDPKFAALAEDAKDVVVSRISNPWAIFKSEPANLPQAPVTPPPPPGFVLDKRAEQPPQGKFTQALNKLRAEDAQSKAPPSRKPGTPDTLPGDFSLARRPTAVAAIFDVDTSLLSDADLASLVKSRFGADKDAFMRLCCSDLPRARRFIEGEDLGEPVRWHWYIGESRPAWMAFAGVWLVYFTAVWIVRGFRRQPELS